MASNNSAVLYIRNPDERSAQRHLAVDDDPKWVAKVKYVLENGAEYADLVGPLLVAHDVSGGGRMMFYPLPYIFRTERERAVAAARLGKTPPPETWVQRKVRVLQKMFGRQEPQVA